MHGAGPAPLASMPANASQVLQSMPIAVWAKHYWASTERAVEMQCQLSRLCLLQAWSQASGIAAQQLRIPYAAGVSAPQPHVQATPQMMMAGNRLVHVAPNHLQSLQRLMADRQVRALIAGTRPQHLPQHATSMPRSQTC